MNNHRVTELLTGVHKALGAKVDILVDQEKKLSDLAFTRCKFGEPVYNI